MRWLSAIWTQIWITLVIAAVCLALYSSLGRQLMPLVGSYQSDLEQLLSDNLRCPVSIKSLQGDWRLLSPVIRIQGVRLGNRKSGIRIPLIEAELDVSASVYHKLPIFKRINIQGVQAKMKQLDKTRWQIADQWVIDTGGSSSNSDPSPEEAEDGKPLWLQVLELQQSIFLSDWQLHSTSLNVQEQLAIKHLLLRYRGGNRSLEGTLAWGTESMANVEIRGHVRGGLWPWKQQTGELYVEVGQQDWTRWIPEQLGNKLGIPSLTAGLKGWLSIEQGDLHNLYIDASLPAFELKTAAKPLSIKNGTVFIRAQHDEDDWHLRIRPQLGMSLPVEELTLSAINMGETKGWQVNIPSFDVSLLTDTLIKHRLLPDKYLRYFTGSQAKGRAENLNISFIPGTDTPGSPSTDFKLAVESDLINVTTQPFMGIPALGNISGRIQLTPDAGRVTVENQDFSFFLAGVYEQAWQLQNASGEFFWHIQPDFYRLWLPGFHGSMNGMEAQVEFAMRIPEADDVESNISVLLGVPQAPASMKSRLVPSLLDKPARQWIEDAILDGQFTNAAFALNGRVDSNKPDNSLSIQLYSDASDVHLRYLTDWPEIRQASGRLLLDSPSLDVWVDDGVTLGGQLVHQSSKVTLRPKNKHTHLNVSGQLSGSSEQGLKYFTDTPLQGIVNHAFDHWQVSGAMEAELSLAMPLGIEGEIPDIDLDIHLENNQLHLDDLNLQLDALNGTLNYSSQHGLSAEQITGQLFGGEFNSQITSHVYDGGFDIDLKADGDSHWQHIKQWMPLFLLDPVSGKLNYTARLGIRSPPRGGITLNLLSDLQGTIIDAPSPIGKTSTESRSMTMTIHPEDETVIHLDYQGIAKAALAMDDRGLNRGLVMLGGKEANIPNEQGVSIQGSLNQELSAEGWWNLWQRLSAILVQQEAGTKQAQRPREQVKNPNPVHTVRLKLPKGIDAWGMATGDTQILATQSEGTWRLYLNSQLAKGAIILPSDQRRPVNLYMDYIHLPVADNASAESTAAGQSPVDPLQHLNPADFLPMNLQLNELYIGTRNFGRWNMSSRPQPQGMKISLHDSDMKGLIMTGEARWLKIDSQHSTLLEQLQVNSYNIEDIQKSFIAKPMVRADKTKATLQLDWLGSPMMFNTPTLSGLVDLRFEDGVFDTKGAEALKALSALNFNSIGRRLQLDFSDLYQSGVTFDVMKARAKIEQGVLTLTEPMLVEGSGGKFLMAGSSVLPDRSLDMKLAVTFPITSTLPMFAILAGLAPPVAAAIYVSERLIGDELERFTSASYNIKGTWEEPDINISQTFDNNVEGKKPRSLRNRLLSIFGLDDEE